MSKKPRIKPTVKRVIVSEALKDRDKPRRQLALELQAFIEKMGEIVPAEETLEKIISWTRNHEPYPEDKPWSLVSSSDFAIPSDATPVLLKIWKQQLNWFEPFTIRQAKWVSRLFKVIPDDLVLLAHWSNLYAITERACDLLGVDHNSESFDAALVMGPRELLTAFWTGAVKITGSAETFPLDELVQMSKSNKIDLMEELNGITKLWIEFCQKGPKWLQLNAEQQGWIQGRLRLWVLEHPWTEDPSWLSWFEYEEGLTIEQFQSHHLSNPPNNVLKEFASNPLFKPLTLLEEVGYESNAFRKGDT